MSTQAVEQIRLAVLHRAVAETSQSEVARRIQRSTAAINQVIKGTYAGDPAAILERVAAEFGNETVQCPAMGEVPLGACIEARNRPFAAVNPMRVRLYKACRQCERNKK
jgi:hypothetical protein